MACQPSGYFYHKGTRRDVVVVQKETLRQQLLHGGRGGESHVGAGDFAVKHLHIHHGVSQVGEVIVHGLIRGLRIQKRQVNSSRDSKQFCRRIPLTKNSWKNSWKCSK